MPGIFSEYCGPDLPFWKGSGIPRSVIDLICYEHDNNYNKILKEKGWFDAYVFYNEADELMLKRLKELKPFIRKKDKIVAKIAEGLWKAKKKMSALIKRGRDTEDGFITPEHKKLRGAPTISPAKGPPLANLQPTEQVNNDSSDSTETLTTMNHQSTGAQNLENENAVKRHKPSYGLQDTHTAVLPVKVFFNVFGLGQHASQFKIRLNSPWKPIVTPLVKLTTGTGVKPINYTRQFLAGRIMPDDMALQANVSGEDMEVDGSSQLGSGKPGYDVSTKSWQIQDTNIPDNSDVTQTSTELGIVPVWREYWRKMYKSYHTIGTQVTLTMQNISRRNGDGLTVGYIKHTDATAPPVHNSLAADGPKDYLTVGTYDTWKNTERVYVPSAHNGNPYHGRKTITIDHKNGFLHDTTEADQTAVWTLTGANPDLNEYCTFFFFQDPLCPLQNDWDTASNGALAGVNCELTIKYLVQFKDLKNFLHYYTGFQSTVYDTDPTKGGTLPEFADIDKDRKVT